MPSAASTPASCRTLWITVGLATVILILFFVACVNRAKRDSVSWDESQHLYSGFLAWKQGDFGYNPEVPPAIKMWDAIPLLHRDTKQPAFTGGNFKREGFVLGQRFLATNGIDQTLIPARIMASLLSLFLAAFVFFCAREMFGDHAALFALLLVCLDPNILANGSYVTTDIGASLTMLLAVYAFYRYVKQPTPTRMILVGVAAGLTMTAKFTGVFIVPILILIAAIDYWQSRNKAEAAPSASPRQLAIGLSVALVVGIASVWTLYHFRYAARPGALQLNPTSAQYLHELRSPLNRWALTTVDHLHLLPEAYIYGLADTKISAASLPSYFFGHDDPVASRLYFPAAFIIKSTLPFLLLLVLTLVIVLRGGWHKRREIIFLTVPALFLFLLCTSSDLGIGYRHLLPMLPLLYILVAGCAAHVVSRIPKSIYAFAALLLWQFITTAAARPGLLAYANEAWGGPSKTHLYLSDSNVDWGQQLKAVKHYLDTHPSEPCYFAYFAQGPVDFHDYGIDCHVLPTGSATWMGLSTMAFHDNPNVTGTVLISDGVLAGADIPGKENPYLQFKSVQPSAVIDRGVYVYRGSFQLGPAAALEHIEMAREFAQQHNTAQSMSEARTALDFDPGNPEALTLLGDAMAASGDPERAQTEYTAALHSPQLDPAIQKALVAQLKKKTRQ